MIDYLIFLGVFLAAVAALTVLGMLIAPGPYFEVLGLASLCLEAVLGVPQFIRTQQTKSITGLRYLGAVVLVLFLLTRA